MPALSTVRAFCTPRRAVALLCTLPFLFQIFAPAAGAAATPIALGVYTPGAPGDLNQYYAYRDTVGTAPAIVMWYQDWAHGGDSRFPRANMETVAGQGAMPLLTWEPWDWAGGVNQPNYSLAAIAGGAHDAYIRQWARDAAAWNKPFYLRFAHEMNGDWYPWAAKTNGNSADAYVAAWRHVVAIFRQEGATNARWVWSVNVVFEGSTPLSQLYPGDEWVDWVAIDGYNWGNTQGWSSWQSLADIFAPTHDAAGRLTNKPMMLSEVASTEVGGNKANWITQGFLGDLAKRLPRIRAVVWFNENKEQDWRMNSTAASLNAWSKVASSPQYKGRLP